MIGLLLGFAKEEVAIADEHLIANTNTALLGIGLLLAFFAIRPELWRRLWFDRVDPRPAALMRIAFGLVVLWTFLDLVKPHPPLDYSAVQFLFSDEGLWLTDTARKKYGGGLAEAWDPEHGFEQWTDLFPLLWGKFTFLHFRSDPPFVWAMFALMCTTLVLMIMGVWTRTMTVASWILVESFYRYSPVFYTGGDTVVRVFLFLGIFAQWGQAYSFDSWWWRRKAILRGKVDEIPALKRIPAWPMRFMMLQLAIIYCATGLLKSGGTWADGTALYYALNLDHFYRWPQTGLVTIAHFSGLLPVMTIFVHWWEILFPLALIGAAINAFERERRQGVWPKAALWRRAASYLAFAGAWICGAYVVGWGAYYWIPPTVLTQIPREQLVPLFTGLTGAVPLVIVPAFLAIRRKLPRTYDFIRHYVLGKRFWLVFGFGMHIGIDVGMNVGTFAEVMMSVYLCWFTGEEIDAFWRYVMSRPRKPGEGTRPIRKRKLGRLLLSPLDRLLHRAPGEPYVVLHHPSESSVRRAALLRVWDLGGRLEFAASEDVGRDRLVVSVANQRLEGRQAAAALTSIMPALWWLRPIRWLMPGFAGAIALAILEQRG